jgi:hypothetical protein
MFNFEFNGTSQLVLVHPMEEHGITFLPCCYGYATTIRRAQGASLDNGCVYFENKRHHAGRGYAYVAISRFRTRAGCHLYGKLRLSDFLPVGVDRDDEVWERGDSSQTSGSEYEGACYRNPDEYSDPEDPDADSEWEYEDEEIEANPLNTPSENPTLYNEADWAF